jgi:ribosomal protein S18 acetylase RimI-like enzyme
MVIREAESKDLEAIIEIDTQVSNVAKPAYWRDTFSSFITNKDSRFFLVAEQGQQVKGFIIGEVRAWEFGSAPCGWVFAIGVTPEQRQHRIASKMLGALCDLFLQAGVTKVRTMTAREDHVLLSFFRSQGMMAGPYQQLEKDLLQNPDEALT